MNRLLIVAVVGFHCIIPERTAGWLENRGQPVKENPSATIYGATHSTRISQDLPNMQIPAVSLGKFGLSNVMTKTLLQKIFACLIVAALTSGAEVSQPAAETKPVMTSKKAILVELFTSEGCSSCPPADRVLIALQKQPLDGIEIITLSEHVTYWNYLGWGDPFSQEIFSERQRQYASKIRGSSVYTPQMVIDGKIQLVGSNYQKALAEIKQAAHTSKDRIEFEILEQPSQQLKLNGTATTEQKQSSCIAAVVEDGLISQVRSGENSGERLPHNSVVREWLELGNSSAQKPLHFERHVPVKKSWNLKNMRIVLFLQTPAGEITTAATTGTHAG